MKLFFPVTICLGKGDGGDVLVQIDTSKEEYELLVEKCIEDEEISDCGEFEDLCSRIVLATEDECDWEYSDAEEDLDEATYLISYPSKVIDAAEKQREK